jgi:hypothetical protein
MIHYIPVESAREFSYKIQGVSNPIKVVIEFDR